MPSLTYDQLAARFECLGDNCELGTVQRLCGAEPLGLFRFTAAGLENIIDVIATGGAHLFTSDDVDLSYNASVDEYILTSKHYAGDFQSHTFERGEDRDYSALRARRVTILAYLKKRFFEDMLRAEKIYVRKSDESIVDLRRLHAELKRYGPNILLWVTESDRFHDAGTIEKIEDGLWRGYVQRFKRFSIDEPIDLASWVSVLDLTSKRCNPDHRLSKPDRLAGGKGPSFDPRVVTALEQDRGYRRNSTSLLVTLRRDTGNEQAIAFEEVRLALAPGAIVVVSAWINIDPNFVGERVDMGILGFPVVHIHPADLSQRGTWQRIWATARIPKGQDTCVLSVRAGARQGSTLAVDSWVFETGPVPSARSRTIFEGRAKPFAQRWTRIRERLGTRLAAKPRPETVLHRSSRALAEGRFIEADDMIATALAEKPDDHALLKQYAFSAHNSGRYLAAILRWRKALAAAPDDPMCHAGIASNFREFGELNIAALQIASALALFPEDGTVLTEAARIAMAQHRYADALSFVDQAIERYGPFAELLTARAMAEAHLSRG